MKLAPIVLILVALCTSCNKAPHSNAAIRQGIVDHLSKGSGLNLDSVDIDITNVAYQGDNKALATVYFRPKSSPDQGMSMNYTLEAQGKKWVVQKRAGGMGQGMSGNPHGGAGAPDAGGMANPHTGGAPPGNLPPGHPPVSGGEKGTATTPAPQGSPATK